MNLVKLYRGVRHSMVALTMAVSGALASDPPPAFPGAEGFGAGASGGRGGEVYEVTNLDDSGAGSLRDAVKKGDRTVVFRVSGTIELKSALKISVPNMTIAGQTAPGDGICLRGHELFITNTRNVVVRYLRVRPGDEAGVEHDSITIWASGDVILDHCSMSWSTDSINDVVKESGNVTVQWCILSEPLCQSVHLKGSHGYATGWDGRTRGGGSYHHNLIAHAASRAPRIGFFKTGRGLIDVVNNVIYNCGPSYGGEGDDFNFVGNYIRPGPENYRRKGDVFHVSAGTARAFIAGNVVEGKADISANNALGVEFEGPQKMFVPGQAEPAPTTSPATQPPVDPGDAKTCLVDKAFNVAPVKAESAESAYQRVLAEAGATLPRRDAVDQRILKDVRDRTGKLVNSQSDVGGWPELKSAQAPADDDHDGMPNDWEIAHQLNPADPSDGARPANDGTGYTNLELYLNHLVQAAAERK